MTRQVLNSGLTLTEGVLDKGNLIDLMAVINRSDANFAEVYERRIWVPSDVTGATDMTSDLEAFVAANQGYMVKVPDSASILLKNAFSTVTTGHILIDFGSATILYNNNTVSDAALFADNVANVGSEFSVSAIATAVINDDATVSKLTMSSPSGAARFDWYAFYSTTANPGKSGGFLGEIFQVMTAEAGGFIHATRKLNKHAQYSTGMNVRKLDATRRVDIRGGRWTANGNTQDTAITNRCPAIWVRGFVDPSVKGVTFDRPWQTGLRFQACAQPRFSYTFKDVGNLATYNGFTYGCTLYGMNDGAIGTNIEGRNGRHGFTTDGNSAGSTTWYNKGIPTNWVVDGVTWHNCHGSVVDTHEEGDGGHFLNVSGYFPYQDENISPDFTGAVATSRASNCTYTNIHCYGGTNGVKITAIDHGFEDQVHLNNVRIYKTTQGSTTDNDTGINVADQSALTNKRHVYLDGATFGDVGRCIFLGKTAKMTATRVNARKMDTFCDNQAGSLFVGRDVLLDYRDDPRTASYFAHLCRSDAPNGGCTIIYLNKPAIIKGSAANQPTHFFEESDTTAAKTVYLPGLTEYNPSAVTASLVYESGATTFTGVPAVTDSDYRLPRIHTAAGAATIVGSDNVLVINKTSGAATVVNLAAAGAGTKGRSFTIKDGKGDAASNNITLTPASGTIDGAATNVINANYGVRTVVDNGTEWNVI